MRIHSNINITDDMETLNKVSELNRDSRELILKLK